MIGKVSMGILGDSSVVYRDHITAQRRDHLEQLFSKLNLRKPP